MVSVLRGSSCQVRRGLIPSTQEIFGDLGLEVNTFFRKMSKSLEDLEPLVSQLIAIDQVARGTRSRGG